MEPPVIPRRLDLRAVVEQKSCFLFGPRQTGKSTLIRQQFADCPVWNLLDQALFLRLSRNPALIRESLADRPGTGIAVIDEIQRMPELLNEVHLLIEEHGIRFLLTGSSARRWPTATWSTSPTWPTTRRCPHRRSANTTRF